jgi:hypothetical protein
MAKSTAAAVPVTTPILSARFQAAMCDKLEACIQKFRQQTATPVTAYAFEKELKTVLDETGREILEQEFNRLEPEDKKQAVPRVRYHRENYRINKKTAAEVATSFGSIRLRSFLYLCDEPGEAGLHPLHVWLGIQAGAATAVLAERVARWAVDHPQREVRQLLLAEHGLQWSNDRLRTVLRQFRREVVRFRASAQKERLLLWLAEAERSRGHWRPALAVGRDGIMVPIRDAGYREASTATLSVYNRRGQRLGTVYLAQMPQAQQTTLSQDLTALLKAVLKDWSGPSPRLVYITDKGQAQDRYWERLRRLPDPRRPGQRLHWKRVLDFFHVCNYLGKLREALFGEKGHRWYARMRRWLRERPGGPGHICRSATQHRNRRQLSAAARKEFDKAYRYLRRHQRWMDYARYRRLGLPIGSGVTEAACKTVFTQRFKRSGMRWKRASGQVILDLRVLHLSGVWDTVVRESLLSRALPEGVRARPAATPIGRRAA